MARSFLTVPWTRRNERHCDKFEMIGILFDQSFIKLLLIISRMHCAISAYAQKYGIAFVTKREFAFLAHDRVTLITLQLLWPLLQPYDIPKIFCDDRRKRTKVRLSYNSAPRGQDAGRSIPSIPQDRTPFDNCAKYKGDAIRRHRIPSGILWLI